MRVGWVFLATAGLLGGFAAGAFGQSSGSHPERGGSACLRGAEGDVVPEPADVFSREGVLKVELEFRSGLDERGHTNFCYVDSEGRLAPNLRVHPGDTVILTLRNEASVGPDDGASSSATIPHMQHQPEVSSHNTTASANDCSGGPMVALATNLHFHGLEIPPVCHQDETLKTSIRPGARPFEYRFQIPTDTPPGLYWYHPHPHGFSKMQVLGGASGALIVEGVEREAPIVAGLPERVLIVRDQDLVNPDAEPVHTDSMPAPITLKDAEGDAINSGTAGGKPAKDLSLNFVAVPFPKYVPAVLQMKPGAKEFWRVLNASAITYLDLQVLFDGKPQAVGVVALDGVPVHEAGNAPRDVVARSHVLVPPAGRVELIVKGPGLGVAASFVTRTVDTGPAGENDPTRPLASIVASVDALATRVHVPLVDAAANKRADASAEVAALGAGSGSCLHGSDPAASTAPALPKAAAKNPRWIGNFEAVKQRKLYFSEEPLDPKDPSSPTKFYVTVDGETPKQFDMNATVPNIVVRQGDVEEWTIENRTQELHAFHIHQIHFQLEEWNGVPVDEPYLRDTINVAYWDGHSTEYPSVKLKMDFRDPRIVGTFMYHCHLLEHEDGGMMGTVQVVPATRQ
jgi:FtsP/CotA-like multicopper oxidase with cupredoxin domain